MLNSSLRTNKITTAPQGVNDLFMALIFNAGNAKRAFKICKVRGVFGLYMALKNASSKTKENIKSVSNARKKMRLELIREDYQKENFEKASDNPTKPKPKHEVEKEVAVVVRLSKWNSL